MVTAFGFLSAIFRNYKGVVSLVNWLLIHGLLHSVQRAGTSCPMRVDWSHDRTGQKQTKWQGWTLQQRQYRHCRALDTPATSSVLSSAAVSASTPQ